jgi:hypothetical protein
MAIDVKDNGLDTKLAASTTSNKADDLIWEDLEDGKYSAELFIVYPWKSITKDTYVKSRDADGKYIKDDGGNFVKELMKDTSWNFTDLVFRITDGMYEGYAVKGAISTHPDMIGSAKRFLYAAKLFDVALKDLKDYVGIPVSVYVKHKQETWKDKQTGVTKEVNNAYVSYYDRIDDSKE